MKMSKIAEPADFADILCKELIVHNAEVAVDDDVQNQKTAVAILDALERYRLVGDASGPEHVPQFRKTFMPRILKMVKAKSSIEMTLPAFPFKSPNIVDKVQGKLPDKGEEVSLALLQGICNSIEDVYQPGARLTIVSDGIVYNDLLGVSDLDVWNYSEDLRKMATRNGHKSINFARISQAAGILNVPKELVDNLDEEKYQKLAPLARDALMKTFGDEVYDAKKLIEDENIKATYLGYLKFLAVDLALERSGRAESPNRTPGSRSSSSSSVASSISTQSNKAVKRHTREVAKKMIVRGKCFAAMLREVWPEAVRLSIHASNCGDKISIAVLPSTDRPVTPWHSSMLEKLDGSFVPVKRSDIASWPVPVEQVYDHGRLYYYRECGLRIAALKSDKSYAAITKEKLRKLAEQNPPVIAQSFAGASNMHTFM